MQAEAYGYKKTKNKNEKLSQIKTCSNKDKKN